MKNNFMKLAFIFFVALFVNVTLANAQTPDPNDPGIGGPGSSSVGAPSSDGVPVVPFDGGMSIMLLASGLSYASSKLKRRVSIENLSF
jgi:hypothetical protein